MARPNTYDHGEDQIRLLDWLEAEQPKTLEEMRNAFGWSRSRLDAALRTLLRAELIHEGPRGPKGTRIFCIEPRGPPGDGAYAIIERALEHTLLERHREVLQFIRNYPRETWSSLESELDNTRGIQRRATRQILRNLEAWGMVRRKTDLSHGEEDIKRVPIDDAPPKRPLTLYEALGPPSDLEVWARRRSERARRKQERERVENIAAEGGARDP